MSSTGSPMRVTKRDMRVARGNTSRARLRRRPVIGNTASFVRSVLLRHVGRRNVLQPFDRAFRRPFFAAILARHTHRHDQRVNLRIGLGLQPLLRQREIGRPFLVWRAAAPAPATAAPRQGSPDLVTRILARERRIESTTTIHTLLEHTVRERARSEPGAPVTPMPARPAPAVPMIVRRPAALPAPTEASLPRPPGRPDVTDWGLPTMPPRPAPAAAPIPLSPTELSRLTDQVVSAIDHRFTAHRERHGRI